jgi:hypothetical protein
LGLRNRAAAISRLDKPRATSSATRVSWEVNGSKASGRPGGRRRR